MYEFSSEMNESDKAKSLYQKINDYIQIMDIKFNGSKVMLVVNGLVMGSLTLINNTFSNVSNKQNEKLIVYNENLESVYDNQEEIKEVLPEKQNTYDNYSYATTSFVKAKNENGIITYVDLNKYIINELRKLVPPTYSKETLKSLSVIIRTNIFKDLYENRFLKSTKYQDISFLKKLWKKNYNNYYSKFKKAVEETNYQYMSSNNYYFNFNNRNKYQIPFNSFIANNLAKKGYNYLDILGHFYPDAFIETV